MKVNKYIVVTITALFFGCSSDNDGTTIDGSDDDDGQVGGGPTTVVFDRGALLENWADNSIIPAYEELSRLLANLETAVTAFTGARNEPNFIAVQEAWRNAYVVWQRVSMFEIGPAEAVDYRLNMNIYPTDAIEIEANVANGNVDLSLPSNRDAKGFPALDYLLNGTASSDAAILIRFNDDLEGDNLANYLELLIVNMVSLTNGVLEEWQTSFRDDFIANDGSSATASVDLYVNDYIFYYERILRAGKMGIPAGVFSGSVLPQNVEAFYDGTISNALFLEGLDAVQDFFNGVSFGTTANGIGLDDYLNESNSSDLRDMINEQFNLARDRVGALNSFQEELQSIPPVDLLTAYDEIQRAVPLIKVDMLSVLNINVDFQDADGD